MSSSGSGLAVPNQTAQPGWLSARSAILFLTLLFVGRAVVAAIVPLAPDEAYYALWATHLAAGYFDHPPMIAYFIRPGTMLFGETPLGVRFVCLLATLPASWLVWRAAERLIVDRGAGALAAILYNVTLLGFFGTAVATPDAPLALIAAAMAYSASKLLDGDRPVDWLVMGLATGLAFQAKYSAALLAAGFAVAVLAIPAWRRRLLGPWPWLALAVALLVFAPNIIWNAQHDWATFLKQGGRVTDGRPLAPLYVVELIAAQMGLMTPLIFVLAMIGLLPRCRDGYRSPAARRLLLCLVAIPIAYFLFHALRSRVEGNWPGFLYPVLSIAAAAAMVLPASSTPRWLARISKAAIPVATGLVILGAIYVVVVPFKTLGPHDPILRMTRGWPEFAADADALRQSSGASFILTDDYQLNAELALLLPKVLVLQFNQRERYSFQDPSILKNLPGSGMLLSRDKLPLESVPSIQPIGTLTRRYDGIDLSQIQAYRIDPAAKGSTNP